MWGTLSDNTHRLAAMLCNALLSTIIRLQRTALLIDQKIDGQCHRKSTVACATLDEAKVATVNVLDREKSTRLDLLTTLRVTIHQTEFEVAAFHTDYAVWDNPADDPQKQSGGAKHHLPG
jgi:hypothetical protein